MVENGEIGQMRPSENEGAGLPELGDFWFTTMMDVLRISTISLALCTENTSTCSSRGAPLTSPHISPYITWQVNAQTLGILEATGTEQLVIHPGFSKSNQPDPTANL